MFFAALKMESNIFLGLQRYKDIHIYISVSIKQKLFDTQCIELI